LESEVQRLKEMTPETLQKQVTDERKENDQLRAAVRANRRVFSVIVVVAFCLGVAIEYAVVHRRSRKPTREGLSK
ncbi:MAG: hypothetical protein ACLPT4_07650, partial [Verrucomicrobiia bacterium]